MKFLIYRHFSKVGAYGCIPSKEDVDFVACMEDILDVYELPFAISWDDSKFSLKNNSFYKVDMYDGTITEANGIIKTFTNKIKSSQYGYANASNVGVTWYADLIGHFDTPYSRITKLHGYGSFQLVPKSTTYNGSTILYGHYVHPTMSANININVGVYGYFGISGGSNYDERGNATTVSWLNAAVCKLSD